MGLAENLTPIAGLVGTWNGPGHGDYPTIDAFDYTETVTFTDIGKPFLAYVQRTRATDGRPLHTESGFLRVPGDGTVEFTIAQPTGQTELCEGTITVDDTGVVMRMRARVVNSRTAKQVDDTERVYRLSGDDLTTEFAMAAVGQPLTHHLSSRLRRGEPTA